MTSITLKVNGRPRKVQLEGAETLLQVLRNNLGLTGAKQGCNQGVCGSCTVLLDGVAALSCLHLAANCQSTDIVTVEGLGHEGGLSILQQAFVDAGAVQCGFCMPGMVMAATALLNENPYPDEHAIREGLSGNLCRCSGYVKVTEAVKSTVAARGGA